MTEQELDIVLKVNRCVFGVPLQWWAQIAGVYTAPLDVVNKTYRLFMPSRITLDEIYLNDVEAWVLNKVRANSVIRTLTPQQLDSLSSALSVVNHTREYTLSLAVIAMEHWSGNGSYIPQVVGDATPLNLPLSGPTDHYGFPLELWAQTNEVVLSTGESVLWTGGNTTYRSLSANELIEYLRARAIFLYQQNMALINTRGEIWAELRPPNMSVSGGFAQTHITRITSVFYFSSQAAPRFISGYRSWFASPRPSVSANDSIFNVGAGLRDWAAVATPPSAREEPARPVKIAGIFTIPRFKDEHPEEYKNYLKMGLPFLTSFIREDCEDNSYNRAQLQTLSTVNDRAIETRTDISTWDVLKIFNEGDSIIMSDTNQVNRRFFEPRVDSEFLGGEPQAVEVIKPLDISAIFSSGVKRLIKEKEAYLARAQRKIQATLSQFETQRLNYMREKEIYNNLTSESETVATGKIEKELKTINLTGVFEVVKYDKEKNQFTFRNRKPFHMKVAPSYLARMSDLYRGVQSVYLGFFDIHVDYSTFKTHVYPYGDEYGKSFYYGNCPTPFVGPAKNLCYGSEAAKLDRISREKDLVALMRLIDLIMTQYSEGVTPYRSIEKFIRDQRRTENLNKHDIIPTFRKSGLAGFTPEQRDVIINNHREVQDYWYARNPDGYGEGSIGQNLVMYDFWKNKFSDPNRPPRCIFKDDHTINHCDCLLSTETEANRRVIGGVGASADAEEDGDVLAVRSAGSALSESWRSEVLAGLSAGLASYNTDPRSFGVVLGEHYDTDTGPTPGPLAPEDEEDDGDEDVQELHGHADIPY